MRASFSLVVQRSDLETIDRYSYHWLASRSRRQRSALRTLTSFYLIETKYRNQGEALLDLHPIIRQFVRKEFPKKDREKFAGRILSFFDRMIGKFKAQLPNCPSYEILENWTRKADIQITFGQFEAATSTLAEIASPLLERGYPEEWIRLTNRLFSVVNWANACSSYVSFDSVFGTSIRAMVEMGRAPEANLWLAKYQDGIPGKSAQYVHLCDLRCYLHWFVGDFESAIQFGEEGERLRNATQVDTGFSCSHNFALALRDSGKVEHALQIFLGAESLSNVLDYGTSSDGKDATFYGNIGRCMFLMGRPDDALGCYIRSAQMLEAEGGFRARRNGGYARYWLGQLHCKQSNPSLAAMCFRAAICAWEETSPCRTQQPLDELRILTLAPIILKTYLEMPSGKVEAEFLRWLDAEIALRTQK